MVCVEALCICLIWLLFIVVLGLVFYFERPGSLFDASTSLVIAGILFLSLAPFLANWEYYSAIWKAWRDGNEIIYRESSSTTAHSVLGNREVWIKN